MFLNAKCVSVSDLVYLVCLVCLSFDLIIGEDTTLPTCQPTDFHWEYTECDSDGGRWKVQVPQPKSCTGGAPRPAERGAKCEFACEAGQYLDVQNNQQCKACPAGTFSLGGGVRFEDWEKLPAGFVATSESFGAYFLEGDDEEGDEKKRDVEKLSTANKTDSCATSAWTPNDKVISSLPGHCSTTLSYTVSLVKAGTVTFEYQYEDDSSMFRFELRNSKCQTLEERRKGGSPSQWPKATKNNQWAKKTVALKSGTNTLSFITLGLGVGATTGIRKPVRIKSIDITGIAFTQECTKCRAGTKSEKDGATLCTECPMNTFSVKGATTCSACQKSEYSASGSAKCEKRPACTDKDYYEYHSDCKDNQTKMMHRWNDPKTCRDESEEAGAANLPVSGKPEPCPPCSPGMSLNNGRCEFCPANEYSDGTGGCKPCPENTAAENGVTIQWWNNLPLNTNLSSNCLALSDTGCSSSTGWVPSTSSITTANGHSDDAFLVLSIRVSGFKGNKQRIGSQSVALGKISFVFELICESKCTFFFMKQAEDDDDTDDMDVLETWVGTTSKQIYSFDIFDTEGIVFTWAFQKMQIEDGAYQNNHKYMNDIATLYSVNITNTESGGASECKACPQGTNVEGCIPCPPGHYIAKASKKCTRCPPGTVVRAQNPWGADACMECGQGLTAHVQDNGDAECVTSCKYNAKDGKSYDFTTLSQINSAEGTRLFTSSGTQYYHHFNISLCGGGNNFPHVTCYDNITESSRDMGSLGRITSMICRSTIIPPKPGEMEMVVSAQPSSIGDILVNITNNGSELGIVDQMNKAGFSDEGRDDVSDVHFYYRSESATASCKAGRSTVITLRCDISAKGVGRIELPPKCSDGTCDGCNFHFLWRSEKACPICKDEIYKEVRGECLSGEQEIHYIGPKYCSKSKEVLKQKCSILPMWLEITIMAMCAVAALLLVLIIYCWKHNRKLEYKYMKLIGTSENRDGSHELPAAETCALSEDDDDEQFDSVQFKESKGTKFFSKIKNMGKKRFSKGSEEEFFDGSNPFEQIGLSDKEPLT